MIKIKELPQIKVSTTKRVQFLRELSEGVVSIGGILGANKLIFCSNEPRFLGHSKEKG
jgi:hypothetical protein